MNDNEFVKKHLQKLKIFTRNIEPKTLKDIFNVSNNTTLNKDKIYFESTTRGFIVENCVQSLLYIMNEIRQGSRNTNGYDGGYDMVYSKTKKKSNIKSLDGVAALNWSGHKGPGIAIGGGFRSKIDTINHLPDNITIAVAWSSGLSHLTSIENLNKRLEFKFSILGVLSKDDILNNLFKVYGGGTHPWYFRLYDAILFSKTKKYYFDDYHKDLNYNELV